MNLIINSVDRLTQAIGNKLGWLVLVVMALQCLTLLFNMATVNATALQEATLYCHSAVFLLAMGFNLYRDEHVRVDVFYRRRPVRTKAWVNALGSLVLTLPIAVFTFLISLDFVSTSWSIREVSVQPGGLPTVFLFKTLIPIMAVLLALQAIVECLRNLKTLGAR